MTKQMIKKTISKLSPWQRIGLAAAFIAMISMIHGGKSDSYIRSRVLFLNNPQMGACTGEQVRAPSGKDYILTAAHCSVLAKDGSIQVTTEDGKSLSRKIIAEDPKSDLLLLEGVPNLSGLGLARSYGRLQDIRTFTHGRMYPTYETSGKIVGKTRVVVPIKEANTADEIKACTSMPKYVVVDVFFGSFCALSTDETVITAMIVPGSSGGPVLDSSGDLIGVASATDGSFGYLVTLDDIHNFVDNY